MSWKTHIEELRARERLAEQMGGEERVAGVEHNVVNAGAGPLSFVETEVKAFPG